MLDAPFLYHNTLTRESHTFLQPPDPLVLNPDSSAGTTSTSSSTHPPPPSTFLPTPVNTSGTTPGTTSGQPTTETSAASRLASITRTKVYSYTTDNPCGAKRKRTELWTAVSGSLALISRACLSPGTASF